MHSMKIYPFPIIVIIALSMSFPLWSLLRLPIMIISKAGHPWWLCEDFIHHWVPQWKKKLQERRKGKVRWTAFWRIPVHKNVVLVLLIIFTECIYVQIGGKDVSRNKWEKYNTYYYNTPLQTKAFIFITSLPRMDYNWYLGSVLLKVGKILVGPHGYVTNQTTIDSLWWSENHPLGAWYALIWNPDLMFCVWPIGCCNVLE